MSLTEKSPFRKILLASYNISEDPGIETIQILIFTEMKGENFRNTIQYLLSKIIKKDQQGIQMVRL